VPSTPAPSLRSAARDEVRTWSLSLDQMLPPDHPARAAWAFAEGVDLAPLYVAIRAVEGHPGHPHIDPRLLFALWLYATLDGVGSARELERLCGERAAYRWLCGGVSVNYHTLAAFRGAHPDLLDRLLTRSVAALVHEGLVTLNRVAMDGVQVRPAPGPTRSAASRPSATASPRPSTRSPP
jgi:transposase